MLRYVFYFVLLLWLSIHCNNNIPETRISKFWKVESGFQFCEIVADGRCVTDGFGNYGNHESCTVKALQPLILTTVQYDIQSRNDYITVGGARYEYSGPAQLKVAKGTELTWRSDGSSTNGGFKVCAQSGGSFPLA